MDNRNTRCAYHLTEKSDWGAKSITVSNLPVYCRIATSVTVCIGVAWAWNQEGIEKLVSNISFGTYHPNERTTSKRTPQFLVGISQEWSYHLPSIRNFWIFCQMVSTLVVYPINRVLLKNFLHFSLIWSFVWILLIWVWFERPLFPNTS